MHGYIYSNIVDPCVGEVVDTWTHERSPVWDYEDTVNKEIHSFCYKDPLF